VSQVAVLCNAVDPMRLQVPAEGGRGCAPAPVWPAAVGAADRRPQGRPARATGEAVRKRRRRLITEADRRLAARGW